MQSWIVLHEAAETTAKRSPKPDVNIPTMGITERLKTTCTVLLILLRYKYAY